MHHNRLHTCMHTHETTACQMTCTTYHVIMHVYRITACHKCILQITHIMFAILPPLIHTGSHFTLNFISNMPVPHTHPTCSSKFPRLHVVGITVRKGSMLVTMDQEGTTQADYPIRSSWGAWPPCSGWIGCSCSSTWCSRWGRPEVARTGTVHGCNGQLCACTRYGRSVTPKAQYI